MGTGEIRQLKQGLSNTAYGWLKDVCTGLNFTGFVVNAGASYEIVWDSRFPNDFRYNPSGLPSSKFTGVPQGLFWAQPVFVYVGDPINENDIYIQIENSLNVSIQDQHWQHAPTNIIPRFGNATMLFPSQDIVSGQIDHVTIYNNGAGAIQFLAAIFGFGRISQGLIP